MTAKPRAANRAASVRARLLALAKERSEEFNLVLSRYAIERWLYRLSTVPACERFLLKGALLFGLWFDSPHRPTRDADLLGFGSEDPDALATIVREVCSVAADDGLEFDLDSIRVEEIRENTNYGGLRVTLTARLDNARCPMQLDVGYGDAVTPGPQVLEYPAALKDLPSFKLQVYPRESVFAEKLEALVSLGMANTRMKDYFDLRALALEGAIDKQMLTDAIAATCRRRKTSLSDGLPIGLTEEFSKDAEKQKQWLGFLRRNRLEAMDLATVVQDVRGFVEPALNNARKKINA